MTSPNAAGDLRLSGVRAFLGIIRPEFRRVGVRLNNSIITVDVILDCPPSGDVVEEIAVASTEIIADFPDLQIEERITVETGHLSQGHAIDDGLIYQRWELDPGRGDTDQVRTK